MSLSVVCRQSTLLNMSIIIIVTVAVFCCCHTSIDMIVCSTTDLILDLDMMILTYLRISDSSLIKERNH